METNTDIPEKLKLAVLERIKPTEPEREKLLTIQEELASKVKTAIRPRVPVRDCTGNTNLL